MCLCQNPQPHPPPKQGYWGRACIESGDTLIPSHLRHKLCKVPETPSGQRSDCSDLPKTRTDYTEEGRRFPGTGSDWGWSRLGGWARKGEHGLLSVNLRLSRSEISYSGHQECRGPGLVIQVNPLTQCLHHCAVTGQCEVPASASFKISPGDTRVTLGQEDRGS